MNGILALILFATLLGAPVPVGQNSSAHDAFPEIHDWNSLRISLNRWGCLGECPVYQIEIHGDGTVIYDGKFNVARKGRHSTKISHASLIALMDVFRKANYFALSEKYSSAITDYPTYVSSISFDGVSKSVTDYAGRDVGMPQGVSDVEVAIDRLSGACGWIGRTCKRRTSEKQ